MTLITLCSIWERILMTKQEAKVIVALANNGLSGRGAARSLNYHHNTIYYHKVKILKATGLDPYDFFDMQKLLPMAEEVLAHDV